MLNFLLLTYSGSYCNLWKELFIWCHYYQETICHIVDFVLQDEDWWFVGAEHYWVPIHMCNWCLLEEALHRHFQIVLVCPQALCGLLHSQASFGFMQIPHDGEYMELCYVFQFLFQCYNTTQLGMSFLQRNIFNVFEFVLINNKKLFLFDKWFFRIKN